MITPVIIRIEKASEVIAEACKKKYKNKAENDIKNNVFCLKMLIFGSKLVICDLVM